MVEIKKKLHYLDVNNYIHHSYDVILSMVFNCKELENNEHLKLTLLLIILKQKELNDVLQHDITNINNYIACSDIIEAFN